MFFFALTNIIFSLEAASPHLWGDACLGLFLPQTTHVGALALGLHFYGL
jgi:hypothetical protein